MLHAYLLGLVARHVEYFAGDAKPCWAWDASLLMVEKLLEVEAAGTFAAQRDFSSCENAMDKNWLRGILLESRLGFEGRDVFGRRSELWEALGWPWSMAVASP